MAKPRSAMSFINITHHNENIYNIIKKETPKPKKSPIYKSKFRENVRSEYMKRKRAKENQHATMGLAEEPIPNPRNFLKKRSKPCFCCKLQQRGKPVCSKGEKLPPLPDLREARTCKATQTDRNFVCENVKYVVEELVPKRPRKYVVYSKNGDKEDIFGVLEPKYIYSTKFGKAPAYLRKMVKVREEKKKEKVEERNAEDTVRIRCVSSEERERILKGLKHNLEEVMKEYLRLPIFTDTLPKINKKLRLEADIKQLEKDIELVEKHPCIYVYGE